MERYRAKAVPVDDVSPQPLCATRQAAGAAHGFRRSKDDRAACR